MGFNIRLPRVVKTNLTRFLDGGYPEIVLHDRSLPPRTVVSRALSMLGREGYNLLTWNCEHFANYCKEGVAYSRQVITVGMDVVLRLGESLLRQLR